MQFIRITIKSRQEACPDPSLHGITSASAAGHTKCLDRAGRKKCSTAGISKLLLTARDRDSNQLWRDAGLVQQLTTVSLSDLIEWWPIVQS